MGLNFAFWDSKCHEALVRTSEKRYEWKAMPHGLQAAATRQLYQVLPLLWSGAKKYSLAQKFQSYICNVSLAL